MKSVFANSEIIVMISGGIMRMNGLGARFMLRLSSARLFFESAYEKFEGT